jgi:hypothetical protein
MGDNGIDALVEARIREALATGALDDLPGAGKPLVLDDFPGLTPEARMEALLLRTLGEVSEEVLLLREIRADRERIAAATDEAERERLRARVRDKAETVGKLFEERRKAALDEKRGGRPR